MSIIKAILVDDEESALLGLQQKIKTLFPNLDILEIYQKPEEAIKGIQKQKPDLVFLDIEMPRINGFDLLTKLEEIDFQVIFVTAYNEYALKAIKQSAVDYILKPIDDLELKHATEKAISIINDQKQNELNSNLIEVLSNSNSNNDKIVIPTTKGISFIPEDEVFQLEGYKGYTRIHLTNHKSITSSYNLGKFEKMLSSRFFKCHKSHIINLDKVRHFENEGYIVLENEIRVPISKTNKKEFVKLYK